MLYIIDTDHMTLWQHGHPDILANLKKIPTADRAVTSVSLAEQMRGWLAAMGRAQNEAQSGKSLQRLVETFYFYNQLHCGSTQ